MASAMRSRRRPARMTLSQNVDLGLADKKKPKKEQVGPFSAMNQTEARLPHRKLRDRPQRPPRFPLSPARRAIDDKIAQRSRVGRGLSNAPEDGDSGQPSTASKPKKTHKDDRPLFHALKMQQALTPLSYTQRDKIKEKLEQYQRFEDLGLMPQITDAVYTQILPHLTEHSPTPVQKLAIPSLLHRTRGSSEKETSKRSTANSRFDKFLIAGETGSGKTLAYLLPIVNAVKQQEEIDRIEHAQKEQQEADELQKKLQASPFAADQSETEEKSKVHPSTGRPRALILLPSTELIIQVTKVVKLLSHSIKYRSAGLSSINSPNVIRSRLFNPNGIDIVISTPHLISSIAQSDPNILSRVQHLVLDEADSLLDRSFSQTSLDIIERCAPSLKQLVFCSATIPNSLDRFIDKHYPDTKRLVTPKIHTIPRRVQLGAVDIDRDPYRGNRKLACADVIWTLGSARHEDAFVKHTVKHILVFVNEREKAEEVAEFLASKGIEAVALTRDTTEQRQAEVLESFTSADRVEGEEKADHEKKKAGGRNFSSFIPFDDSLEKMKNKPSRHLANTKVLVTTDLGSRGIDTLAVRNVVLYDVPHTTVDFVHRLGRMGRMNRRGRGVVLMGRGDRKDIIREVREAMHKGQALI
ncbi:hypothetical protein B0A52_05718 [Exophiala mesophila]|uniref:RNA helicase n=1 Tax=Exophiala mesophila TaxID=212818 RepID=A0A438N2G6_EXOME|nr:hypothetical protein B0A52_05718 [Exophiala mesophila]